MKIIIISSSVRIDRKSHRVALYFEKYISENKLADVEIIDLAKYNFPVFTAKLKNQINPTQEVLEFAEKVKSADGIIIVTPEYNGGYPASLKNVVDVLYEEWYHKPIAISTVSDGVFGGSQALISLQFSLWKIRAVTVAAMFPVRNVDKSFDAQGNPADKSAVDKLAQAFINELLWCISLSTTA